jgi:uncharacterized protein (TIGR02996 family)
MDQEQAFLEAIRRRPGSGAERLVYADWLTDQGNPRGEFMHLQYQARHLPGGSPQRLDLEARAHDLLLQHEADWLGPLLGQIGNWEWRDGLIDWVTVPAKVFLANAKHWLPALPLLGVHLRQARKHIARLARCKQLQHVNGLFLGDNDLHDADLQVLAGSPHLGQVRSLYLQSNRFGPDGVKALAESPNLPRMRRLNLGHNFIGDEGLESLARSPHLKRLRALYLTMTGVTGAGLRALASSPLLSRLLILDVGMNRLEPGSLAELAAAPGFRHLRVLGYGMNQPSDADVAGLAGSPHAAGLRALSLDTYNVLGDAALTTLAAGPHLGRLRSLTLGAGAWGPASARALGRSRRLPSLRTLQLCPSTENGRDIAKALLGQPLVRRLRNLRLDVSDIGVAGLAALASHPRPLRLRRLRLRLTRKMASGWENILDRGLLTGLTDLILLDLPAGAVRPLLVPGRLPALQRLTLGSVPDLDEFQALLDSPLFRQIHAMRLDLLFRTEEKQGPKVLERLCAAWRVPSLHSLGLRWTLPASQMKQLAAAPLPPGLTELEVDSYRLGEEGMAALAGWPILAQLRRLVLTNSSANAVPGLEALAVSPHVGPLLRVDIENGNAPDEAIPALRKRFGIRFAVAGRMWPRVIHLGGWHQLLGDGAD